MIIYIVINKKGGTIYYVLDNSPKPSFIPSTASLATVAP